MNTKYNRMLLIIGGIILLGIIAAVMIVFNRKALSPDDVAGNFYRQWIRIAESAPPSPVEKNLHMRSTYVTDDFGRSVAAAAEQGRDAVLCLGKAPVSFSLAEARTNDDGTRAVAQFTADGAEGRVLMMRDERSWWRIDEVDCEVDLSPGLPPAATTTATSTGATTTATSTR